LGYCGKISRSGKDRDIGKSDHLVIWKIALVKGMSLDKHQELRSRTKSFALRIMKMCRTIPSNRETNIINNQILRSATGMAANYRAVGLPRSKAEFISKLGIVIEEADETVFWLELLGDSGTVQAAKLRELLAEGNQLVAIFLASRRTAKA
jgi:four helix bundle protein